MTKGNTGDPFPIIWPKCENFSIFSTFLSPVEDSNFWLHFDIITGMFIPLYVFRTQKHNFHEKFPVVVFLIAGHINLILLHVQN